MNKTGAGAYIYAKASGIIGKSFIESRAEELFNKRSLSELWTMLFTTSVPGVPEVMLADQIEKESFNRFMNQYISFVNLYDKADDVLYDLLDFYEYQNLKEMGASLCNGESKLPQITEIGKQMKLRYSKWPNLAEITKNTPFEWYNRVPSIHEQQHLEYLLDLQWTQHLWNSVHKLSGESKEVLEKFFTYEYAVKNIIWVLRLRINYKMEKDKIIENLIHVTKNANKQDPVAGPAIRILETPIDEYEQWRNWEFSELLNPYIDGEVWKIDPLWLEKQSRVVINRKALHMFRQYPMTTCSLVGWYKIKEYELSCIRTAVEGMRLNISPTEAMSAVGIVS